ncbi:Hypothetical predicted protein, partial [Pelobates cultripes]
MFTGLLLFSVHSPMQIATTKLATHQIALPKSGTELVCPLIHGPAGVIPVHSREATLLHKTHEQVLKEHYPAKEKRKMADDTCYHTSWDLEARLDSMIAAFWRKLE